MSEKGQKQHHHRSSLKQRNKPFKGGSRSKSRGRVESKGKKPGSVRAVLSKADRRNRAVLIQKHKRSELAMHRRIHSGRDGMPRVVVVLPVTGSANVRAIAPFAGDAVYYSEQNKQRLRFVWCERGGKDHAAWLLAVLEAAQIADCVVCVASALDSGLDEFGRDALAAVRGVGVSAAASVVQCLAREKNTNDARNAWLDILQAHISSIPKVYCADSMGLDGSREAAEFERALCQQHFSGISWRDVRPYLLSDAIEVVDEAEGRATVRISGFVRGGRAFSANRLVHLPEIAGTFALSKIEASPRSTLTKKSQDAMMTDGATAMVCQVRDEERAEPIDDQASGDPFSAEAMMLAAEEMIDAQRMKEEDGGARRPPIVVPKGTSSYQAVWLGQDETHAGSDEEVEVLAGDEEGDADGDGGSRSGKGDDEMDVEEHRTGLEEHKRLISEQLNFSDEIDLDASVSARRRLQKYRGVQSLRTSTWDPNENLPFEYSRIFRFANYKQSRKLALEQGSGSGGAASGGDEEAAALAVGAFVHLYIRDVPVADAERLVGSTRPVAVFGLLKHEQLQTVLNFTFTPSKEYKGSLRSKEELVAVFGFRKYTVNPVFSDHSTSNLHKMLRTIDCSTHTMVVGTVFAPVHYSPCPVLLFRADAATGQLVLVGSGSVSDLDPQRVVLKRITLTGSPYRVHKRSVVVRFMFSNPADINWFKPVELTTRHGARGHIRESLGMHGHMKCHFDRTIFQHEVVAMHLYKRVFPKWTTRPLCPPHHPVH